ncbi:MAG: Spy/CpxP family protein refolding chaperone [Cycloclasticus pugetii]|jgi:Spy/CpxP family protein refolding chaperone|uniref:Spy/CpxP family protein refolding chaperone n=1 Tax=Cycloclasticus TaxID=34067 RepID=UPI00257B18EE|nr:Spy/CpxP family protein refolding chaperone [Cycloclasticus sp.]MBV1899430.1 Spy/CpxP family protein refolding chaperone [Cycloclasticus sp.]
MNIKAALLTSAIALTVATSAYADRPNDCSKGKMQKRGPSIAHLQEELDLTDKQADSLKALFKEQRAKQKELRKEQKENRDIMHEKISNILTKEQMEEFEEMKPKKPRR